MRRVLCCLMVFLWICGLMTACIGEEKSTEESADAFWKNIVYTNDARIIAKQALMQIGGMTELEADSFLWGPCDPYGKESFDTAGSQKQRRQSDAMQDGRCPCDSFLPALKGGLFDEDQPYGYLEDKNHIERCMCDRRTDASVFRPCQYGETVI